MRIRKTTLRDLDRVMEIYAAARQFMAQHGNPNQWGPTNWPPEALIRNDIAGGCSYVCENEAGKVAGTFFFTQGPDIEPTYRRITDGKWLDDSPYGVVHRIASDGSEKGIGAFCINWAYDRCGHLRIDTHGDNTVMQNLVRKLGFVHCGTIYVEEDNDPRLAYEKSAACTEARAFQTVAGLSHVAVRTRSLPDSVRYYTDVLGLREAFRMYREDGSLATVYMYLAPGQYLELFSDGTREGISGPDVIGMSHLCLMTKDIRRSCEAVKAAGGPLDSEIRRGKSMCRMFWTHDPDGTQIEVMEMPPESLQARADRRFEKEDECRFE